MDIQVILSTLYLYWNTNLAKHQEHAIGAPGVETNVEYCMVVIIQTEHRRKYFFYTKK